ncbi:small subunit of phenylpropionate dioxygenase [Fusarium albosuccineum]|uniref:Small subunit of phenylpropionate dioxygenase n=1 Tax=Fusarium albosuccineum TaxID=1237068 RepID=A0A8H4L4P7_9HYPO|nr:small subunit of phenylpropionate dioxygenase [Fusarium albosuccineum]
MSPTASDHELIRNCIARFALGADLGDWTLFSTAFREDVKIEFPFGMGSIEGVSTFAKTVQSVKGTSETQHALSTQIIEVEDENTAAVTTYGTAVFVGTGQKEGKTWISRVSYKDKLVKGFFDGKEDWRIIQRKVVNLTASTGDESLESLKCYAQRFRELHENFAGSYDEAYVYVCVSSFLKGRRVAACRKGARE